MCYVYIKTFQCDYSSSSASWRFCHAESRATKRPTMHVNAVPHFSVNSYAAVHIYAVQTTTANGRILRNATKHTQHVPTHAHTRKH